MKVHNDLKELLEDFCYKLDIQECMDAEFSWQEVIIPYVSSNSLASSEPKPLAKNKQFDNACDKCSGNGMVETIDFAPCNRCFGTGEKQA